MQNIFPNHKGDRISENISEQLSLRPDRALGRFHANLSQRLVLDDDMDRSHKSADSSSPF